MTPQEIQNLIDIIYRHGTNCMEKSTRNIRKEKKENQTIQIKGRVNTC